MINSKPFSENDVEEPGRKNSMPEPYEMESERNSGKDCVLFNSLDHLLRYKFRLKDREDLGFDSVEHSGIYIIIVVLRIA
mgnify:CR=1 FL=1